MKARVRVNPPEPPGWVYEPKWDGFRVIAWSGPDARLDSRNGKPLVRYFPELLPALEQLPQGTVVDGEVVVVVDTSAGGDDADRQLIPGNVWVRLLEVQLRGNRFVL